ncbi:hypothetical protein DL95DRAFT_469548 [Leptodontidium sp. 2 PMI_412]|nr:hypothetical protein DL95DRAFT_469548 [Leptodontidium sp. 2 PMI_412]
MSVLTPNPKSLLRLILTLAVALLVILCSFTLAAVVHPSPSNTHVFSRQSNYVNNSSPGKNKTEALNKIRDNVHYYALPYGGLGFGSHILTYYCMFVNAYGRRPLVPWKRQDSIAAMLGHGRWLFVRRSRAASGIDRGALAPSNVMYDPNGYDPPAPGYPAGGINPDSEYNTQSQQYNSQAKPYPLADYCSTPQYEPVNMRGGFAK